MRAILFIFVMTNVLFASVVASAEENSLSEWYGYVCVHPEEVESVGVIVANADFLTFMSVAGDLRRFGTVVEPHDSSRIDGTPFLPVGAYTGLAHFELDPDYSGLVNRHCQGYNQAPSKKSYEYSNSVNFLFTAPACDTSI